VQILATILMLLLFGVVLVFIYSVSNESAPMYDLWKTVLTVVYIHFESFQIAYIGDVTTREVKSLIFFIECVQGFF
jgi:hypothetical protein